MTRLRIATRGSALARWQADHVAALLHKADPGVDAVVVVVETSGDRRLDVPIWELGGKGVFVKEVQAAVLDGRADVAVHSAKDLPSATPDGLVIGAVPERADVRDALVGSRLDELAAGAVVAQGYAKAAVDEGVETTLAWGLDLEQDLFERVFATEDSRIGVRSFLESGPG
ncbi:MAG TPA: hypothetical protein VJM49_16485, partial [Acidimicrobiales bacterium]|nr:hypothetical protein [Acidimicrobiales bacterium]